MAILGDEKLKVFIGSTMAELRDVREIVGDALQKRDIEVFLYEESAGARPEPVVATSLEEVEKADVYVGLFWQRYGEVTIKEYRHARKHDKPCFVYIREQSSPRDSELEAFLKDEVYDLNRGVTYKYFTSALHLGDTVARDIVHWLVRRHRKLSAVEDPGKGLERLTKETIRSQPYPVDLVIIDE